jgi:O-antigen ligase
MNAVSTVTIPRSLSGAGHVRSTSRVGGADLAGGLVLLVTALLGAFFVSGVFALQLVTYGICIVAVLPHLGPFIGSLGRNPANLLLVLLFTALAMSTFAVFARVPAPEAMLQVKTLAATAVWASIYIVTFSSLRTTGDVLRLTRWIGATSLIISASVYLSALFHIGGFRFGEVLQFSDGAFRAFGPLGDNVGFLLVIPALMSLVAARPLMFGIHLGALFLTATRGAMLCLVVGALAYLLIVAAGIIRPTRKRTLWGLAALAVGSAVWLSPVSDVLMDRLTNPSMRGMAIQMGMSAFQENPLLGTGFNGFGSSRPAVAEDWLLPRQTENALSRTMNQYIQTATDGGVVALGCLLLFVLCTGRNALRVIRWGSATPQLVGLQLWLIAVLAGNQGALWFLSNTGSGFFIFAVAGLAARASALAMEQTAPRRRLA